MISKFLVAFMALSIPSCQPVGSIALVPISGYIHLEKPPKMTIITPYGNHKVQTDWWSHKMARDQQEVTVYYNDGKFVGFTGIDYKRRRR